MTENALRHGFGHMTFDDFERALSKRSCTFTIRNNTPSKHRWEVEIVLRGAVPRHYVRNGDDLPKLIGCALVALDWGTDETMEDHARRTSERLIYLASVQRSESETQELRALLGYVKLTT